ncbi:MAG: MarR family transcriptional regulator [Cryobacterium sp.]|nr:MarR family transcriptional regulator [Cryobacterium sp.]
MRQVVPRMDQVQAGAWMALMTTAQLLPAALDEQLTADAALINFEYGILAALNVAPDQTMRMGELAAAAHSPAPRLSKAVNRLEARGLVERVACAGDGRAINVHLTREGRRTWLQATPPHIEFARDTILGSLTPDQLTALTELLQPIISRLDPDACPSDHPPEQAGR